MIYLDIQIRPPEKNIFNKNEKNEKNHFKI